tara:strand:- start:440 stop:1591 length:1152 start_codon:yes stop_codon:yes gene_type:complete
MYQLYFAERDTTLYEKFPDQNTGIDQILELTKVSSGSKLNGIIQANTTNTRILLDFGTQISSITADVSNGKIPPIGTGINSSSVFLTLKASDASDLPLSYTIKAFPISESWSNGNGTHADIPITTNGASWHYKDAKNPGTVWTTGSAASYNNPGVFDNQGGGTWMTGSGYEASQSFQNQSPDIRMNVTDIVQRWVDSDIANNGFMIKRKYDQEINGSILGTIKFFGRESHTIFLPRLEVAYNDVNLSGTGSFNEIATDMYVPYIKNIRSEYRSGDITKFRIGVRPEFPVSSYATSSFYLTNDRLPVTSYYSVSDTVTNEVIIPFDETIKSATQISCDSNGSFFKLNLNTFLPERYYKISLKVIRDNGDDTQIHDDRFYFKVVK